MITFSQYLIETFNTVAPYRWEYKHPNQWKAVFVIGEFEYFVILGQDEDSITRWSVVFDIENRQDDGEPFSLSGTGQTLPVFSTITRILVEFSRKNYDIRTLVFTADEPSRQKFYDRWSTHLAKAMGGWNLKILPRSTKKYILSRPR